ncbi:hypothetical protein pb186bvf_015872 [Paramecium bursaria]
MAKNEVCIFVEKEICPVIDYRWSKITMGTEYKFSKVLKSTNEQSIERMKNFISFERIQQVHSQNSKGSCICINGTYERHKTIYYNLVRDYLSKFQNNVLKVAVLIQGIDAPYQLIESQSKIDKTRLEDGRISSSKFMTDAFINQVNQIEPYLEQIDQEIILDRQLNVNITLSIFNRFTITRTYNLILVQENLNSLIQYWKTQISSRTIVIFKNTLEQSKTIVSFLNDQNRKELPNYLYQLSLMQDVRQDNISSYVKSDNKPINNKFKYKDEMLPKINPISIGDVNLRPLQRQDQRISKVKPVLSTKPHEIMVINTLLENTIKQNNTQTNKMSKQQEKQKAASKLLHQSQKVPSKNRFQTPIQRFSQKQQSNNRQLSNKQNNSQHRDPQRVARDIIIKIQDLLKDESERQILMLQICKDPLRVEVLSDQASKKFEIKRSNVKPKFKIQLIDGVFDMRDTKIILKKGNCDSDEQQKKFKSFIEICVSSNLKYFHLIEGKLPKEFFSDSQKKKKLSKVEPKQDRYCQIS